MGIPKCQHSHNTKNCRIFHKDGSYKQPGNDASDSKNVFAHCKVQGEILECFAQIKNSNEDLCNAIKRNEGHRRYRYRNPLCNGCRHSRS